MAEEGTYRFGGFRLDAGKRVLWRDGELVRLAPKALDLLRVLVEQAGDVVSKDELMRRVWPDTFVEEANLSVNVSALRKALGRQADGREWIETVPRRGYRFLGRAQGEAPPALPPALAVLPFRALGPEAVEEDLAIGMTDALITRLHRGGGVLVRPTRAVLKYAGARVDPREAGRELQVEAVLDGTLQRQGGRLRLTLQLVPLTGRFRPWAGKFEEELRHVFEAQDAAAEAAARELAEALGTGPAAPAPARPAPRPEAWTAYLRGRSFWSRLSGPWLERALTCFQEAAEADPAYAPPHAGLADAYLVIGLSGVVPPREAWPLVRASAHRALELDARAAEAHVSLGLVALFEEWDWAAADRAFDRAEALDPHSATVPVWRALSLDMRGRFEEASRARELASRLDPLSLIVAALEAFQRCLQGDHEGELERYRRALELDPGHFLGPWGVGLALQHLGRHREAVGEHERAVALSSGSVLMKAVLARSLALAGRRGEAEAIAAELDALPYVSPYQRSTLSLALGDRERTLGELERALEERDPWLVWLSADPMLRELRAEPRFQAVRTRVYGPP